MADKSLHIRLDLAPGIQLGPGKANLLEAISQEGSIRRAGEKMGMSVKKTATLVDDLNSAFKEPVIEATKGGAGGGGAVLTKFGARVLEIYRRIHKTAEMAAEQDIAYLNARLRRQNRRTP